MEENFKKQRIIKTILENKWSFLTNLFIVLTITFSILYLFGLVPDALKTIIGRESLSESKGSDFPIRIKIPAIEVDAQIYNPATTSVAVLDDYLLRGAVRYPGSGLLDGKGNVFIFGHSTGIKIVNNQAFKTFNGLKDLKKGELIYVYSDKYEYTYKVMSVNMESADKALVNFDTNDSILTLSTCNSFGAKTDRYVVQAEFLSKSLIR